MKGPAVSAPGKAFLSGEYAVTEGAQAIVAAVDRRVLARWDATHGDGHPSGPEALAAFAVAQEAFGRVPQSPTLDRGQLFHRETKLGLGSSAAAAVAVAGSVAARHGHDLDDPNVRRRVFESALTGHERIAPNGSGADVAAATHGGFIRFERNRGDDARVERIDPPESLVLSLVWTGTSVRTSDLLREVERLRVSAPASYDLAMSALHRVAEVFAEAFSQGDTHAVIEAAGEYHAAMKNLGQAAGAPIVSSTLEQISEAAAREGGAAKPCGAGGGDVAIAFFSDANAARRFEVRCATAGLTPIAVQWGARGVGVD